AHYFNRQTAPLYCLTAVLCSEMCVAKTMLTANHRPRPPPGHAGLCWDVRHPTRSGWSARRSWTGLGTVSRHLVFDAGCRMDLEGLVAKLAIDQVHAG